MLKKKCLLAVFLCLACVHVPMEAAGYYKTKKVQYSGTAFYYNGVKKTLSEQPIIIDGKTYLPVRSLCDATGLGITWTNNKIYVTNGTISNNYSMQAEIRAKDYEIASLKKELQSLKDEMGIVTSTTTGSSSDSYTYSQTSGTDILGTELTATRKDLERTYGDSLGDIDLEYSVSLSSGKVNVLMTYDTSAENRAFNELTNREVRNFIEDVCETVRAHHDDVVITGKIRYNSSTKYSFTYSKRDTLTYSADSSSYSSSSLDITESRVISIVEDEYSVDIDGYNSSLRIREADATISDSRERVTFDVYIDVSTNSSIKTAWNDNTGTNYNTALRNDMKSIAKEIEDETDYDILGEIYDYNTGELIGHYDYDDNELLTYSIS